MNLYELTDAWKNFELEIGEDGEVTNADELEALEMERNEKLKNCVWYYKNQKAEAEALKAEKQKLAARQKVAENKAEWIKRYLDSCLCGESFAPKDDVTVKITYRKSKQVECHDFTAVPEKYLRYAEPELNRTAIKKAIDAGEHVNGCTVVEKQNIQIK